MISDPQERRNYYLHFILQLFLIYLWVRTGFYNPLSLLLVPCQVINMINKQTTHVNTALKTFNVFSPFLTFCKFYPCIPLSLYKSQSLC